jgi:hypothetical protein
MIQIKWELGDTVGHFVTERARNSRNTETMKTKKQRGSSRGRGEVAGDVYYTKYLLLGGRE